MLRNQCLVYQRATELITKGNWLSRNERRERCYKHKENSHEVLRREKEPSYSLSSSKIKILIFYLEQG